ncbi:trypsin-like peptidase domain-containing protein [Streptomyces sp. ISL-98]|uniref:VMAP-C domain-containing protein n=1 Tax=Streptomyces sp. ISL-98 TaxID=2819192 RepID=UPI001BEA3BE9|nr:trypsin-like peptidase domain-containing protein [Streptomyces sp. ISL-98]MBT2505956.1 trypsin-like peptidase domain-containing protein [Streptomyces sp. ISL-98]
MPETSTRLAQLTWAATVHFTADLPGVPPLWGSGFFVAPGWLLTCAHVLRGRVRSGSDKAFLVRGDGFNGGEPARARLVESLYDLDAEGRIPEAGDLALVRLLDDDIGHECVWLADWSEQPAGNARVVHGYIPEGPEGTGRGKSWSGTADVDVHEGDYGRRFEEDIRFLPGLSGGPVLDPAGGAVVGVMKARRETGPGGLAIAIHALRGFQERYQEVMEAHDTWHHAQGKHAHGTGDDWIAEQSGLPGAGHSYDANLWTPEDRRQALGLLAALPVPEAPVAVTTLSKLAHPRRRVKEPPLPRAWRDGHGELYDGSRPLRAGTFLSYLGLVQRIAESHGADARELADWVERRGDGVSDGERGGERGGAPVSLPPVLLPNDEPGDGPVPYPGPGEGAVVILELERLEGERLSYDWTIRIDDGDEDSGFPVDYERDRSGVSAEDLIHRLSGPLADAFAQLDLDGRPAPLEIALDIGEFDTAVHRWQIHQQANLNEQELKQLLGVRRPVVLRHLERRGVSDDEWTKRWSAAHAARAVTPRRVPPPGGRFRKQQVTGMGAGEIPVLCRSAGDDIGREVLRAALDAGHGIALWHIEGHPGARCRKGCDALHEFAVSEFAEAAGAAELPDRIRRIRERISARDVAHPAEAVALLYDDPRRPVPGDTEVYDSPS